jgi:iron complex outermembrane receptor protein
MYILVQLLTQIQLMQMVMVELTERFNGQVVETEHPVWGGKVITDLLHNFTKSKIVVGAQYLDIYPDTNFGPTTAIRPLVNGAIDYTVPATIDLSNLNQFTYSRNVSQFGQNGRSVC